MPNSIPFGEGKENLMVAKKNEEKIAEMRAVDDFARQKALELARKIEGGMGMVRENALLFLGIVEGHVCGCPIGMAYVFQVGDAREACRLRDKSRLNVVEFLATELGISKTVLRVISDAHQNCHFKVAAIVERLRKGAYDVNFLASY